MVIGDEKYAGNYLKNISYYRLSAYCLPFQIYNSKKDHEFKPGTTFENVLQLYLFDRELRLFVLDVVERLEISLRTQIIYQFSIEKEGWWFLNPGNYRDTDKYQRQIEKIKEELNRSNEVFIRHYKEKYSSPETPPAWMTFEVISMGLLSSIFKNLLNGKEKKEIARHFGLATPYILQNWMHSMTVVRNICAHHGRLWNRVQTISLVFPQKTTDLWLSSNEINANKFFAFFSCYLYLLKRINPKTTKVKQFKALLSKYPNIDVSAMGFPENWMDEKLWH